MKRSMLNVLICTECKGALKIINETIDEQSNDITVAVLVCTDCAREYPVIHGVPNMFPDD